MPLLAIWLSALFPSSAWGAAGLAEFPTRPLRVIHGFAAGGDMITRTVAAKLAETWGQPVVVDNRPGAGGTLAAKMVANASPDGYTLLSVTPAHAVAPAIYAKLQYDTRRDFAAVARTASVPAVLVVPNGLGVKSVSELIALAKSKPGQLNFSSAGVGSGAHFAGELFKTMARIDVIHVPYRGIPEALSDTMTGRVQYFLSPLTNALPLIKDGKVQALGVSVDKRASVLPEVPTIAEAGLPGYRWDYWYGLIAPARTPQAVIAKLNGEIARVVELTDVRQRWSVFGIEPAPITPREFDAFVTDQIEIFRKIARASNIQAN